ncbi:MAG: toll/interleukin-1 receptor domain-containing protein [Pseudomonadota bacterium]|nr:toll/interleukin-1 receptor domain-containing protein [Pseudomonadota bacterium]
MIKFNGKPFDSGEFEAALRKAAADLVADHVQEKAAALRLPETGEFATARVTGEDLDGMQLQIEGSEPLLALAGERLGVTYTDSDAEATPVAITPKVFLSYAHEDLCLAEHIARGLLAAGVDTWWDQWCISAGDSIRRRIDEGLGDCTHFLVLLTPASIDKPWVQEEMDAGFVRKVGKQARFIALRHDLPAERLPPLLAGSSSPALGNPPDLTDLIGDIHGVSRKPPLGPVPRALARRDQHAPDYSVGANAVAKVFVEESATARHFDPVLSTEELMEKTGLSDTQLEDALYELGNDMVRVEPYRPVIPQGELFVHFDKFWKDWDPRDDALALAAHMLNDADFPSSPVQIDARLGWGPRRLNPAMTYLADRKLVRELRCHDGSDYRYIVIQQISATRRFVQSRS